MENNNIKEIYLAGGCFWGVEKFFKNINGVLETTVGYANGKTSNPKYEEISNTGHVETIYIKYNSKILPLKTVLNYYFQIIDPTSLNKQGGDIGTQYRTGIYYTDEKDLKDINEYIEVVKKRYEKEVVVELLPLDNYYLAEDYHQEYLDKNPSGYCHVNFHREYFPIIDISRYRKKEEDELRKELSTEEFNVTQKSFTEAPFKNKFNDFYKKGIYVDIVTGEPLFLSSDKFESGCGWPSFSKPILNDLINYEEDNTLGRRRIEVRSKIGDSHLGHVFDDGIPEKGGKRYCINSASLKFIPYEDMEKEGYEDFIHLVD